MGIDQISPFGDLPPDHPLVLDALKGIISGPISELRTKVDALITNPTSTLNKGQINYNNILPQKGSNINQPVLSDPSAQMANNILNQIAPTQYQNPTPIIHQNSFNLEYSPLIDHNSDYNNDQMELPLFKQSEISDLHKKLFDIEKKLDIILRYVKNDKNKK
jgi:hypothetical protein